MTTLPDFGSLQRAIGILNTPHVPQVLACLQNGIQPAEAFPDADADLLARAVRRLIEIDAVREVADPPTTNAAPLARRMTLTPRGSRVAQLVRELADPQPARPEPADRHQNHE